MFRIVAYCEDRRLGDVLRLLAGNVRGTPEATPVVNAEASGEQIKAKGNGKLTTMFEAYLDKSKLERINVKEVQAWLAQHGMSKLSYGYVMKNAVKAGKLKASSVRGTYLVRR